MNFPECHEHVFWDHEPLKLQICDTRALSKYERVLGTETRKGGSQKSEILEECWL